MVDVLIPKFASVRLPSGFAKLGWLRMLKSSPRNWTESRSLIEVVFAKEASHWVKPGPRPVLRPTSPYWPLGGGVNAAGLICLWAGLPGVLESANVTGWPVKLGRI